MLIVLSIIVVIVAIVQSRIGKKNEDLASIVDTRESLDSNASDKGKLGRLIDRRGPTLQTATIGRNPTVDQSITKAEIDAKFAGERALMNKEDSRWKRISSEPAFDHDLFSKIETILEPYSIPLPRLHAIYEYFKFNVQGRGQIPQDTFLKNITFIDDDSVIAELKGVRSDKTNTISVPTMEVDSPANPPDRLPFNR